MFACGPAFARIVFENGIERDKKIAQIMVDRSWGATMVLTEPDAGSDVGAGRTKAIPNEDGSWNIEGVKRFITSAEHDMAENIMHLVLARPEGVEGVGGPGTKGLSLFLVPKFHFDHETGELTGERNGAYVTNVEKKMGIKVSTTCEVTFGDGSTGPGLAARRGARRHQPDVPRHRERPHDGRRQGHRDAVDRLPQRARVRQGARPGCRPDAGRPTRPPRASRSRTTPTSVARCMTQKAYAEGLRSLMIYTATWQDDIMIKEAAGEDTSLSEAVNDLLLPLVKGYGSERSWVLLGTESLQTFGGSGFLQDYPIEQYVRDAKIDTLYEGTTAIQGQDLFFRKIVKDKGQALGYLASEIQAVRRERGRQRSAQGRARAARARASTTRRRSSARCSSDLMSANPADENGDIKNIYKVGLNTTRLVYVLGDLVVAWLLLRGAEVALEKLGGDVSASDKSFYEGKVAAAQFFARNVLPKLAGERAIAENIDDSIMELDESAF